VRIQPGVTIPVGSRFSIATTGLLGDRYVNITPDPSATTNIVPGAVVTAATPLSIDELFDRVVAVARRAEDALNNVNRLIGDPNLGAGLSETVRNARDTTATMRQVAENVERTTRTLDRSVSTMSAQVPEVAEQLKNMAADLAGTAAEARKLVRDVAADGQTAQQVRSTVASIERAADGIDKMVRDLQGVINEDDIGKVRASLDEARGAITEARRAVEEGRSVIGRAGQVVDRVQKIVPERIELPTLRNAVRLEYSLWYGGSGLNLGNDVTFTVLPDAPTSYSFTLREIGGANRFGLQVGTRLADNLRIRYGLINSYLGVGLDYQASPSLGYVLDLYNINQATVDLYARYSIRPQYGITLRGQNLLYSPALGVGFFYRF
jgi:phospholipid/cholesterol/gamma-HCH transport system substrate-binding protein